MMLSMRRLRLYKLLSFDCFPDRSPCADESVTGTGPHDHGPGHGLSLSWRRHKSSRVNIPEAVRHTIPDPRHTVSCDERARARETETSARVELFSILPALEDDA